MFNRIFVQTDIGSAATGCLMGLAKFSRLLATISADNITPTTVLQVQQLRSMFHLNRPLAEKAPDVLRMCQSCCFERFAVSMAWRKGDTASYLADTVGGQAVAILLLCLSNVHPIDILAPYYTSRASGYCLSKPVSQVLASLLR